MKKALFLRNVFAFETRIFACLIKSEGSAHEHFGAESDMSMLVKAAEERATAVNDVAKLKIPRMTVHKSPNRLTQNADGKEAQGLSQSVFISWQPAGCQDMPIYISGVLEPLLDMQ